jgi:hypothetical protein
MLVRVSGSVTWLGGATTGVGMGVGIGPTGGDLVSIGEAQSWDRRGTRGTPTAIMPAPQRSSRSSRQCMYNRDSRRRITGTIARIRKVTTRMSKPAQAGG